MINWSNFENKLQERGRRAELSRQTGISTGNIRDWFNPDKKAQPSADALVKISKALDCSVDYLLGLTDIEKRVTSKSNIIPIPILEQKAAAGLGIETNDYSEYIKEYRFFDKTQIPGETELGIIIEGDSMETTFKNGQVIFVKKLDDCDHNDYGIFCITEDEITRVVFKRKILLDDGTYCLRSINPDYKDIGGFNEIKMCRCVAKMVLKS
ncbi:XRE family transcriptional regulator [Thomasclavelia cocleata]|uniref:XRE family transcriptional regulator n=1 Tax=Thomasclavelia cocleata TaxID=69824 RepID=UPI0025A9B854|nr:LexA family transcriptional regulator [Thomasclavelia cocleata]